MQGMPRRCERQRMALIRRFLRHQESEYVRTYVLTYVRTSQETGRLQGGGVAEYVRGSRDPITSPVWNASQFLFCSHSIPQGSGHWAGVSRPCGSSRPTKSCRKAMRRTVRTYVEDVGATIRRKQRFNKKPWRTRFASGICWLETLGPAAPRPSHRLDDLAEAPGSGLGLLLLAAPSGTCTRMPEVPGRVGALGALR